MNRFFRKVSLGRAILNPKILNVEWDLNPIPLEFPASVTRPAVKRGIDRRKAERCNQAVGLPLESSAAFKYMAATGR